MGIQEYPTVQRQVSYEQRDRMRCADFLAMKVKIEESRKEGILVHQQISSLSNQDAQPFIALINVILLKISNEYPTYFDYWFLLSSKYIVCCY